MARRWVALLLVVLLAACTAGGEPDDDGTATPSPTATEDPVDLGDRVAVVVGPSPTAPAGERAAQRAAAEALAELPDVAELRVVAASSPDFARDLALVLADDGFDLVCVVGTGTADQVEEVARARPLTRFCGTDPLVDDPPSNLVVVGLDLTAVARVAGAALGSPGGPVALLASSSTGPLEPLALALAEALPPLPAPSPSPPVSPAPGASADATPGAGDGASPGPSPGASPTPTAPATPAPPRVVPRDAPAGDGQARGLVDELLATDVVALVTLGGRADATVADVAGTGTPVVGIADWLVDGQGELPAGVLLAVVVDRRAVLLAAATAARSSPGAEPRLLGVGDGVLDVLPGTLDGSDAAAERAVALLQRTQG